MPRTVTTGMREFLVIWLGQLVSVIGSGLTSFALAIWVYQQTGRVTEFGLIVVAGSAPGILILPFAGALIDRWDRRRTLMLSDIGAGLTTLAMAAVFVTGRVQIWHVYLAVAVSSTFAAFRWPCISAATTLLVPKKHLGRASGLTQVAQAFGTIVSPALASLLVVAIKVQGVILIDVVTFFVAVVTLWAVRIPALPAAETPANTARSLTAEAAFGWRYITSRRGLLVLMLFFAALNFALGFVQVLLPPLVLTAFGSPRELGTITALGGAGMLLGSLAMSVWGGPRRRVRGVLGCGFLIGASVALCGLPLSAPLLGAGLFIILFSLPVVNGASQAIWQTKVALDVQGRVFAIRRMIAWSSLPVAQLLAGPLADRLEPLFAPGGAMTSTIGRVIGTGPGRGIGLLFIVMGLLNLIATASCSLNPRLRLLEDELPDVVADGTPEAVGAPVTTGPRTATPGAQQAIGGAGV